MKNYPKKKRKKKRSKRNITLPIAHYCDWELNATYDQKPCKQY